ncbi:MAG: hypothetical protein ACRCYD_12390 [Plesiomonas sp.]
MTCHVSAQIAQHAHAEGIAQQVDATIEALLNERLVQAHAQGATAFFPKGDPVSVYDFDFDSDAEFFEKYEGLARMEVKHHAATRIADA